MSINKCWFTATPTHLHTGLGFLCAATELATCNRDRAALQAENIYSLALYRRLLPTSDLGDCQKEEETSLHMVPRGGTGTQGEGVTGAKNEFQQGKNFLTACLGR